LGGFCDYFAGIVRRDAASLAPTAASGVNPAMTDPKPLGPYTLTPARLTILLLGVLALVLIIGAITGGVSNYQTLRESVSAVSSAPSSAP
jgi:hypothetical protein